MKLSISVFIYIIFALLTGCGELRFTDISLSDEVKPFIGGKFRTKSVLQAYGIRKNSRSEIDYFTVMPAPGIMGTQVGVTIEIARDSTITVKRILRSNLVFDPNIAYEISVEGTSISPAAPVLIQLYRGNEGKSKYSLNDAFYEPI